MSRKHRKNHRIESDPSSQKQFWYTMCLRKTVFWTETSAKTKAQKITDKGHPMRAYQCPNCHQWHLTSQVEMREAKTA
jgi:hypothetical protein